MTNAVKFEDGAAICWYWPLAHNSIRIADNASQPFYSPPYAQIPRDRWVGGPAVSKGHATAIDRSLRRAATAAVAIRCHKRGRHWQRQAACDHFFMRYVFGLCEPIKPFPQNP